MMMMMVTMRAGGARTRLVPLAVAAPVAVPDAGVADAVVPELAVAAAVVPATPAVSGSRIACRSLAKLDSALLPLADAPEAALPAVLAAVDAGDEEKGSRLDRMLLIDMADGTLSLEAGGLPASLQRPCQPNHRRKPGSGRLPPSGHRQDLPALGTICRVIPR